MFLFAEDSVNESVEGELGEAVNKMDPFQEMKMGENIEVENMRHLSSFGEKRK